MNDLEHLVRLINSYPSDIKAEALLADLVLEGYTDSDFLVFHDSLFKRGYSRDILKAERTMINKVEALTGIYLARDGIYDLLPEGLFHTTPDTAASTAKGMAEDSRKESQVEDEARKFFRPIENEFIYHRTELEIQERTILQKLNDNDMEDFFLRFWRIDPTLPRELSIRLCTIMPFIREITGNFHLTATCLGAILGENVTHQVLSTCNPYTDSGSTLADKGFPLGKASLGSSLIIGGQSIESCKLFRLSIGPLKNTHIDSYLEGGEITRFIKCFCEYFIPLEIEVDFDVILQKEWNGFVVDSGENQPVVGYSTVI